MRLFSHSPPKRPGQWLVPVSAKAAVKGPPSWQKLLPQPHAHCVQPCSTLILELPSDTYFRPHFLTFNFVLGYSQLITLGEQCRHSAIHIHKSISPRPTSLSSRLHSTGAEFQHAVSGSLLVIHFYRSIPNSLTVPSPHPSVQQA